MSVLRIKSRYERIRQIKTTLEQQLAPQFDFEISHGADMPIPVIWLVVGGALLLFGGAVLWDEIMPSWKGKRIAILGERAVGKTHLRSFLLKGEVPEKYVQTGGAKATPKGTFRLKELELDIAEGKDVGGSKETYGLWRPLVANADYVVYLFRTDRLKRRDDATIKRVERDVEHVVSWLEERSSRPQVLLVGTHCDLDPDFDAASTHTAGEYEDAVLKLPEVRDAIIRLGGRSNVIFTVGSMKDIASTEALVYSVFSKASEEV